jgi:hypothetical protein
VSRIGPTKTVPAVRALEAITNSHLPRHPGEVCAEEMNCSAYDAVQYEPSWLTLLYVEPIELDEREPSLNEIHGR